MPPPHLLSIVHRGALPLVQELDRRSVQQQQLHDQDVLLHHSLVQGCVALVVRGIDGGPVLERSSTIKRNVEDDIEAEPRWVFTIRFFQLFCISDISLKVLGLK